MISQLTSLLANAANAGAGAVSSNVSSSNANVSHSVPSAVPTLSLAQAAALENAARVAVSRLPEQILSIQPLQSEKSASRVLTVSLPSNNAIKAVLFGSYSIDFTVAGIPTLVLLKSIIRYLCL